MSLHEPSRGSRLIPNPVCSLPWPSCSIQHPTLPALSLSSPSNTRHPTAAPSFFPPSAPPLDIPPQVCPSPGVFLLCPTGTPVPGRCYPSGLQDGPFPNPHPSGFQPVLGAAHPPAKGRAAPCLQWDFLGFHLCKGVQWIGKYPKNAEIFW